MMYNKQNNLVNGKLSTSPLISFKHILDKHHSPFIFIEMLLAMFGLALIGAILYSPVQDIYDNYGNIIVVNTSSPIHTHIAADTVTGPLLMTLFKNFAIAFSIGILIIWMWSQSQKPDF